MGSQPPVLAHLSYAFLIYYMSPTNKEILPKVVHVRQHFQLGSRIMSLNADEFCANCKLPFCKTTFLGKKQVSFNFSTELASEGSS